MIRKIERSCSVMSDSLWPPWTVAYQAPLSMGFFRQEYWSGLPFPSPGDHPDPSIKPRSPTLQADALPSEPPRRGSRYGKETSTRSKYKQRKQELNSNPDMRVMVFYFIIFIKEQVIYTMSYILFVSNYLYLTKG